MRTLLFCTLLALAACSSDEPGIVLEGEAPVQTDGDLEPDATVQPGTDIAPEEVLDEGSELTPEAEMAPGSTMQPESLQPESL